MRLRLVFALLIFVSSSVLDRKTAFAESTPIKIGATLAVSGKLAFVGQSQQGGLELGIEQVNQSGGIHGRKIVLITEDNVGDPKQAVSGVTKLLNLNSVEIVFSGLTHITQAIQGIVESKKKMLIYAAAVGSVAKDNPLFFRDWGDASAGGKILAEAVQKAGKKRVVFLAEVNDACAELQVAFKKTALELNLELLEEQTYNPGETDFSSLLLRLARKNPDALALCTFRDSGRIMTQWKNLGRIGTQSFHTLAPFIPVNDTPDIRSLYEENHSISSWFGFIADDSEDKQSAFVERFMKKYGEKPRMEAALAYDDILALADALRGCVASGPLDLPCVASHLQKKTNLEGVAGRLSFDENRWASRQDFLMKVMDGRWTRMSH